MTATPPSKATFAIRIVSVDTVMVLPCQVTPQFVLNGVVMFFHLGT